MKSSIQEQIAKIHHDLFLGFVGLSEAVDKKTGSDLTALEHLHACILRAAYAAAATRLGSEKAFDLVDVMLNL